jgi:hypothetical protein
MRLMLDQGGLVEPVQRQQPGDRAAELGGPSAGLVVEAVSRRDVVGVLPEWRDLHRRVGTWSPFSDPDAQLAWCELFVPSGHECILTVRRTTTRELVAVLPLFQARLGAGRLGVRALQPFGTLHEPLLHELPELLVDPACARRVLAATVAWLAAHRDWDWVELPLGQDQAWFEARWATDAGLAPAVVVHKEVVPTVVLELPSSGESPVLKRNLRESLRRSRNRVKRLSGDWTVDCVGPDDARWDHAVDDLRSLHRARAGMDGVVAHDDVFAGTSQAALVHAVARSSARARPRVFRLLRDRTAVAALLTFDCGDRTWLSVSGVAVEHWGLGAVTLLQWEAVQEAARAGRRTVCFPTGVDTAKLRWSRDVRVSHVFVLVNPRRRSRTWFHAYWLVRSLRYVRRLEGRSTVRRSRSGSA